VEKRNFKRKVKRLNITFSDGSVELCGVSSDFSCKGLFIRTRKSFQEGTNLKMKLELEDGLKVSLTGIVRRSIKTRIKDFKQGMGVELVSFPKEYDDYVNKSYKD
jgi:Tfp pilus assembly protein PilZ